ncbi:LPXTG cell wall anchor domain-containing protein [uncultured Parolsenella sp.]|uniref:LPXTG cell wall anchor domain-containing protein n=1 Tax=uncultured Parolsenella sp. TaxID=2083008 RepID=UPI0025FDFE62|nr:LPXTG cell wall anchor domain-containing protein [uncultured Parolsenella sp.]
MVCALFVSATPALAAEPSITNDRTKATYTDIAVATEQAESGDTLMLGEGNYTLYGKSSEGLTKGKDLTFVGLGADKTAWNIGAEVPNPDNFGTEYNGDYSFDGAGTVTFKNMTMRSGSADYLGFIRANKTVLDDCVVNGKTFYWGYESAEFNNTTFNAPKGDYAIWTYSSPTMTFDGCTFNASGKVINVYTDYSAGSHDITVNVKSCTFNSNDSKGKQALNINDFNMGSYKYVINVTGSNKVTAARDNTTCSQLFGFGGKPGNNTGRTDVTIDGTKVWSGDKTLNRGKMLTHGYTDGEKEPNYVDQENYVWEQREDGWYCTGHAKCGYCGWPIEETVKATSVDKTNCTEKGERVYTATFQHKCFTAQTRSDDLDPLGHDWGEPVYTWAKKDGDWYCTAKRVCKRDASHVEEETVKASYAVTTPASTLKEGVGTYTATFENTAFETQTKTEPIAKLSVVLGKPSDSGKPASGKGNTALPQTGDSANAAILAAALLGVVAVAGSVIAHKRSER